MSLDEYSGLDPRLFLGSGYKFEPFLDAEWIHVRHRCFLF